MENNSKRSLSDIPLKESTNDFGTERYVNGLIKFIKHSSAPITIALQGEWGSGKTSLMNRLYNELCNEGKGFFGININTWEYSMLSTPQETVLKIIGQLVKELSKEDPKPQNKFASIARGIANIGFRAAREFAKGAIPMGGVAIEALGIPTELGQNGENQQESVTLADLKDALSDSIQKFVGTTYQGVIVFVDDLDRLDPPLAVQILELLKNIFTLESCIFVLAIDYDVIVKGLEPKFGKKTDENEREFRSFFDKIIQVPFSLPVSNYRPMNFVLDSLVKIGYISDVEKNDKNDDHIREPFDKIVEYSVGKNPRSIKRLINTLSLLSCIAQEGEEENKEFTESIEGRIVNFAIVALQICYPKIYNMVVEMPNFTKWDSEFGRKMNVHVDKENGEVVDWEDILRAACDKDNYLSQHYNDILNLLSLVQDTIGIENEEKFEENMRTIVDKSSVTGIIQSVSVSVADKKGFIRKLHENIYKKIQEKHPKLAEIIQKKKVTENGGFNLVYNGEKIEIIFRPQIRRKQIELEMILDTAVRCPEHLMGKSFDEMMNEPKVKDAFERMDKCIAPLLKDRYYFEGKKYKTIITNFSEEQMFRNKHNKDWKPGHISQNVSYWIKLANETHFSDKAVIATMADVIIAAYNYRLAAMKF